MSGLHNKLEERALWYFTKNFQISNLSHQKIYISKNMNLWYFALKFVRLAIACKIAWNCYLGIYGTVLLIFHLYLSVTPMTHSIPINSHTHHHDPTTHIHIYTCRKFTTVSTLAFCICIFPKILCSVTFVFLWNFLLPGTSSFPL